MSASEHTVSVGGRKFSYTRFTVAVVRHRGIPLIGCCFPPGRTHWTIRGDKYLLYQLAGTPGWVLGIFYDRTHPELPDYGPFETLEAAIVAATLLSE